MQVCTFLGTQRHLTYQQQHEYAMAAEELGFDGWFRADHFGSTNHDGGGFAGATDAWITLAAIAQATSRIRLGTLVTPVTYRQPGILAIMVAQVDQMSGGRVELGLGAGWHETEHHQWGITFPSQRDRFEMLSEQLAVLDQLLHAPAGVTTTHRGRHYQLTDCPGQPKPIQARLPIIIGGRGTTRTPTLAARYADEYNAPFMPTAEARKQFALVAEACDRAGRTRPLRYSTGVAIACGASEAAARDRAAPFHAGTFLPTRAPMVGTPDEIVERFLEFAEAGVERLYLRLPDALDHDHLELLATRVLPHLRGDIPAVVEPADTTGAAR
jgi:F420-dependent oxidoreductase-like protein